MKKLMVMVLAVCALASAQGPTSILPFLALRDSAGVILPPTGKTFGISSYLSGLGAEGTFLVSSGTAATFTNAIVRTSGGNILIGGGGSLTNNYTGSGLEVQGTGDIISSITAKGARADANTPSARFVMYKDITSGTVTANDVAAIFLVQSDDVANTVGNTHEIQFLSSTVTAGAMVTDIVIKTAQTAAVGTLTEAVRIQGPNLIVAGLITGTSATMYKSNTTLTNGAAAATGTLTNAPAAGNPTKWVPINDNGTTRYIPAW